MVEMAPATTRFDISVPCLAAPAPCRQPGE
jgi:hypothetical protein